MQDFAQSNKHPCRKGDFHTLIFIKLLFNYGLPAHQQHAPDKNAYNAETKVTLKAGLHHIA